MTVPVTDSELDRALEELKQARAELNWADPDLLPAAILKLEAAEKRVSASLIRIQANTQHQKGA